MAKNLEIIQVAIEQLEKKEPEMIKSMLVQFMKSNLRTPKAKKLNLFDYVGTGEKARARPVIAGVYMDKENKVAVVTDYHVIIISKSAYKPTKSKSGIIDKNGNEINGKYVKYEYPFQFKSGENPVKLYDEKDIVDSAMIAMAEAKLEDNQMCPAIAITDNTEYLFPVSKISLLLEIGLDGWEYCEEKGAYYYHDDDKRILVSGVKING